MDLKDAMRQNGPPIQQVRADNPHIDPKTLRGWRRGHAETIDPWSADRGYSDVWEFVGQIADNPEGRRLARLAAGTDASALYGFHEPSGKWGLWAN